MSGRPGIDDDRGHVGQEWRYLTRTGMVTYTARAQRALPVSSSILLADEAGLARRNVRHNAVALGADFALFLVGLAFASQSTILPAFAAISARQMS